MAVGPLGNSWDMMNSAFEELKADDSIYEFRGKRKLTRREKREKIMREYHAREYYRSYGAHRVSYFSVIFRTVAISLLGYMFFGLYLFAFGAGVVTLALYGGPLISFLFSALVITLTVLFISRPYRKRLKFVRKLKKICKERKYRLYKNSHFLKNTRKPSGICDFIVETGDALYSVMFFPAPKRLSIIRFTEPDMAQVITRILKNRFTEILNINAKVNFVTYSFDAPQSKTKKSYKALLMNPAPYSMQAFDKREGKIVDSGSGAEFFGYVAYSGTGFLDLLER